MVKLSIKVKELATLLVSNLCYFFFPLPACKPVYVEFVNSGGCYSKIGRAYWPFPLPQAIYLGRCADLPGHIKHEMMHTLGFYHEHSRSDRDMFVEIKWENIQDGRRDQFETYR